MKHRFLALIFAGITVLFGLGGCSNAQSTERDETSKETTKDKITLTLGYAETSLPTCKIVQKQAEEFEKQTGIHIEFQPTPDAQWRELLKTKLSNKTAPDIFVVDSDPFSLYDRIRPDLNCLDLSNEEFVSRMDESVLPAVSYQGKTYGISFSGKKIWVYTYRKDLFDQLGLQIPTTYEELKSVCKTIKEQDVVPMWQATSSGWHQVLPLFETGPLYARETDGLYDKLNQNTLQITKVNGLLKVLTQMNEFAKLGYYGDDYMSHNMEDEMDAFVNGEFAMTLEGIGWSSLLLSEHPELKGKVGIFVMPWDDNQIVGVNPVSNGFFGNVNSAHKEAILEYFRFLAQPKQLLERLNEDPNELSLCWPEIEAKYPSEFTEYLGRFKTGLVMQAGVSYIDAQWMDVGADIEKMFNGLMTPEEVLNQIAIRREKLATLAGDPYFQ